MAKKSKKWSRITISSNGKVTSVRWTEMDIVMLSDLLYALIKKIPHAPKVLQLVLEKYKKDHEI